MIEVQVWCAPLSVDSDRLEPLRAALSDEERLRADAMPDARPRAYWIADHGWRRVLLGRQMGRPPRTIAYAVREYGKPEVIGAAWHFSASRAGATALYALSDAAEVGIDVEEVTTAAATPVRRVFSARERAALEAIAPGDRARGALACWVRKEAYLKAVGTGLRFPVDDIDVWAGDDRDVRCGEFVVRRVEAAPGLVAALAVRVGDGPAPPIDVTLHDLGDPH